MSEATNQAGLEARAAQNAKTVRGWTVEKQRAFEDFLQAEMEANKAESNQREANHDALDLALAAAVPEGQAPPDDPWTETLRKIETMPSIPGALIRSKTHINVSTAYLEKFLGIRRDRDNRDRTRDQARLAEVMRALDWHGPATVWMGNGALKGYRKEID